MPEVTTRTTRSRIKTVTSTDLRSELEGFLSTRKTTSHVIGWISKTLSASPIFSSTRSFRASLTVTLRPETLISTIDAPLRLPEDASLGKGCLNLMRLIPNLSPASMDESVGCTTLRGDAHNAVRTVRVPLLKRSGVRASCRTIHWCGIVLEGLTRIC